MDRLRDPATATIAALVALPLMIALACFSFGGLLWSGQQYAWANLLFGLGALASALALLLVLLLFWPTGTVVIRKLGRKDTAEGSGTVMATGPVYIPEYSDPPDTLQVSVETGMGKWLWPESPEDKYEAGGVFLALPNVEIRNDSAAPMDLEISLTVPLNNPPAECTAITVNAEHVLQPRVEASFNRWQRKGRQIVYPIRIKSGHRRVGYLVFLIDSRMAWNLGAISADQPNMRLLENMKLGASFLAVKDMISERERKVFISCETPVSSEQALNR